jgi:hypothetical protein
MYIVRAYLYTFAFMNFSDEFPAEFSGAVGRLQVAVLEVCRREDEWPAKVAKSVAATVDFAVSEPAEIRLLTIEVLIQRPDGGRRYVRMVEHFADLLRSVTPEDRRRPASTELALVGGLATTIAHHLRSDTLAELLLAVPELVEFTLLPYLGHDEARRWAVWTATSGS